MKKITIRLKEYWQSIKVAWKFWLMQKKLKALLIANELEKSKNHKAGNAHVDLTMDDLLGKNAK